MSHLNVSYSSWLLTACSSDPKYAAVFINLKSVALDESNKNKTISNWEEACVVLALVEAMKEV